MTSIYHTTHFDNLPGLLARGEILSDSLIQAAGLRPRSIAHGNIKHRRANTMVTACQGGRVSDYVPFYFCPRSPMLYAIHGSYVEGYPGGQAQVLHLVLDAESIASAGAPCCHTDGHAAMQPLSFHSGVSGLSALDWEVIHNPIWRNTQEDNDRKRRKQAEFLVWQRVPWTHVSRIGVINATMASAVTNLLAGTAHRPSVEIQPDWYYPT